MSLTSQFTDESDNQEINEINFRKIHDKAEKVGYSDGIAKGSESVFQPSFDKGYFDGLRTGFELEKFRAFYATIAKSKETPNDLTSEATIHKNLNIPEATNSNHFQFNKFVDSPLEDVSKHQQQYLNKYLEEFGDKLPKTNNLFSLKN